MRVRTEARRDAILATAAEAFMELGFDGTSMAEIALRADCSKPTLYGYFASKEDLFLGVVAYGMGSTVDPLLEELSASAGDDPAVVLKRFGESCLALTLAPQAVAMRRLIIAQMGDPALSRRYWELGPQRLLVAVGDYLEASTRAGLLHVRDAKLGAQQLTALYYAETDNGGLFANDRGYTREAIKRIVARAVDTFMQLYGDLQSPEQAAGLRNKQL